MISKDEIIQYLGEYQDDLFKIVGKHRKPSHALSVEEIVSEVNNHIIGNPEIFLKREIDSETDFKKLSYSIARNFIVWTADGAKPKDKKYKNKKVDYVVNDDEDGEMTAFEYICSTMGEEDPEFAKLNESQKYNNILDWVLNYSHFLSYRQKNVIPYMLKGNTLDEIAQALNVTHQAVSHIMRDAFEKIKQYVKTDINVDSEQRVIRQGRSSINYLFGEKRKKERSISK